MLKGLTTIGGIIGLVSAVITGGLIITAFGTVDAEILEPGVNNITDRLDEFSTPTVRIGDDGVNSETAEEEFRGLVTYNMLTAANCNLVPLTTEGIENSDSGTDIKYFEDYGGFEPAANGLDYEFKNECVPLFIDIPSGPIDFLNPFNDVEESSDLEGRQGKVNFNISESFTITEQKLIEANYDDDSIGGGGFLSGDQPDFWNGLRVAGFVPDGIRGGDWEDGGALIFGEGYTGGSNTEWISDDSDAPDYSRLYNYRVRMNGVPTIMENNDFKDDNLVQFENFERFVRDARYQFCEGAEGSIQSNAKYINFGGEAQGDNRVKENAVYPEVQITEGSRSCLEDIIHESIYNGRDFVDYSINGEECTYQGAVDEEDHESDETGVRYECMLMEDSTSFPEYTGQVEFLKTGWKADQSTCGSRKEEEISDEIKSSLSHPGDQGSDNKLSYDLNEYNTPLSYTTKVELSHPSENSNPGNLYLDMPNDIQKPIVDINMERPANLLADKRVVINILNTDSILNTDQSIDDYDNIAITSDRNQHEFNLTYQDKSLTVKHINSGRTISTYLQPEEPGKRKIIEGHPEQFSLEVDDPGSLDSSQEMNLNIGETIVRAYPLGCVPEAMN